MKTRRFCSLITMTLTLILAACQAPDSGSQPAAPESSSVPATETTVVSGNTTTILLNSGDVQITGDGAQADRSIVTITQAGSYEISGTLSDGQILVEAGKDDVVELVLNGAHITSNVSAAIYCKQADGLIITLSDGTDNSVTDAGDYGLSDEESEPSAAIFSKGDLTFRGTGSLTVQANYNNGIGTKDDLVIEDGSYNITAANHGIRGKDSVTVTGGEFVIDAGNDGIQSNNTSEDKGWIRLEGGTFAITSAHDGIQAESSLTISGGSYRLLTGGGHSAQGISAEESCKGLKAGTAITVVDGTFDIDSADDTIHSNGDVAISGGTFVLASGDDGVHADNDLTISGGLIDITTSYEGLEAMTMTLAGGEVSLVASDDGINVAGGDGSGGMGRFSPDAFSASSDRWLKITGGTYYVNAQGDGIDINGNGEMTGGQVYVNGPTGGGDAALDYDGTFTISGGTLIAAGSSGMAQAPASSSEQASLMLYFTGTVDAGTLLELLDASGNAVVAFTPEKNIQTIVISSPELKDGSAYTVTKGGETLVEVTLSGGLTSITDTGEARSTFGGMGGGGRGGIGGGQPPEGGGPGGNRQGSGGERPDGQRGTPPSPDNQGS